MTQETAYDAADEISLLDLLLPIVENLRLLVFLPFLAGVFGYGASYLIAPTYESVAVQTGDAQLVALYSSAQVASKLVEELDYSKAGETVHQAQERLAKNLVVTFNNKNLTVSIKALAEAPELAQKMVKAAIENVAELNKRRLNDVARLREQFAIATLREREYTAAADGVAKKIRESTSVNDQAALVQSQAQLLNSARDAQITSASLADRLSQIQTFELLQQPTLPYKKMGPKRAVMGVVSALAVGFLILLVVFLRHMIRSAGQDPNTADKIRALNAAWRKSLGR